MTQSAAALIAATRFGFAARGDDLGTIASNPHQWVVGQLRSAPAPLPGELPSSASVVTQILERRRDKGDDAARKEFGQTMRQIYLAEVEARLAAAADSDTPLLERLTQFWSNHFTVSALRPIVTGLCGAFEREAIRPHVTGRFSDMLLAAESHPAMLLYLDNAVSIGPESMAGERTGRGLNENLGREILELHTLGVDGGYTQDDVEALARILTGWSLARLVEPDPGTFMFRERAHEPGAKTLLGRRYAEDGRNEGVAALRDLAAHPATAHHIATKLARHFIADKPPADAVARIAATFQQSGGDLARVTEAVAHEDAVWREPLAKVRTPNELVIASCRVAQWTPKPPLIAGSLRVLDQLPYHAPQPSGWPDDAASWISPEAVLRRAQWCEAFADRMPDPPDAAALVGATLGDGASAESVDAIRAAPSRRTAVALLLASPEFQRR
ncbi:MAG TPA: DUF1800 domain-containing protein [Stellaceae bacterium]|nr:DUF1800 domain-containing protein [Stellaceae bacterium]